MGSISESERIFVTQQLLTNLQQSGVLPWTAQLLMGQLRINSPSRQARKRAEKVDKLIVKTPPIPTIPSKAKARTRA